MRQVIGFSRATFHRLLPFLTSRILSAALVCLLSCLSPVQADPLRIHIVLSEHGGSYQEFGDALRNELRTQPYQLSIDADDGNSGDADLVVAVGMRSAAAYSSSDKPVLNVLVPRAGYDKLAKPVVTHLTSAIYLDQPIERQLSLLVAALPKTKNIGVLYTAQPFSLAGLRRAVTEKRLQLHERIVSKERTLFDALDEVLEESEVLLVLPDTDVYNAGTIRNILLTSYRKQVPLIGISQAYVKAGALCAIYSTPGQIAAQTAEAIMQFADSGKLPPNQYPKEFEVSVNTQVARSLDLSIKDAEKLRNEVRRAP